MGDGTKLTNVDSAAISQILIHTRQLVYIQIRDVLCKVACCTDEDADKIAVEYVCYGITAALQLVHERYCECEEDIYYIEEAIRKYHFTWC